LNQQLKMEAAISIFFNVHTTEAAFLATGCAVKAAESVASGAFDASEPSYDRLGTMLSPTKQWAFAFLTPFLLLPPTY